MIRLVQRRFIHDISVPILGSARCIIFHSKMEQNKSNTDLPFASFRNE